MSNLEALSCSNCAGQLELSGARNVHSLTCKHCGSVLDPKNDFKVLMKFKNLNRPETPLKIGDEATFNGAKFTLIGIIGQRSIEYSSNTWVSHLLYSPTHGYAWVSLENGHFTFSRKVRDGIGRGKIPNYNSEHNQYLTFKGRSYRIWDGYTSVISFAEGELNWSGSLDDRTSVIQGCIPPEFIEVERSASEIEFFEGRYLKPKEVQEAFKLQTTPAEGIGPFGAKPVEVSTFWRDFSIAAALIFGLLFVVSIVLSSMSSSITLYNKQITFGADPLIVPIEITKDRPILFGELKTKSLNNQWIWYEITIEDDKKEPILEIGRENGGYNGYDDGYWSEVDNASFSMVLKPGLHTMTIAPTESNGAVVGAQLSLKLKAYRYYLKYITALMALLLICAVAPFAWSAYQRHNKWESD